METKREVPLPQPGLFSIRRGPWTRLKEELDEQLRLLGFHVQHDSEDQESHEAPFEDYTVHYTGASSSSYQDGDPSSSYFGGTTSWPHWD